jgi:hypothetical protein
MSAMPSFGSFLSRESIVEIARFVDTIGTMSQLQYQALARIFETTSGDTSSTDGGEAPPIGAEPPSGSGRTPSR